MSTETVRVLAANEIVKVIAELYEAFWKGMHRVMPRARVVYLNRGKPVAVIGSVSTVRIPKHHGEAYFCLTYPGGMVGFDPASPLVSVEQL